MLKTTENLILILLSTKKIKIGPKTPKICANIVWYSDYAKVITILL